LNAHDEIWNKNQFEKLFEALEMLLACSALEP